jgi:hypothetical protein
MTILGRKTFEAISAVEGKTLTDEQRAMFTEFDRLQLPQAERRKRIIARYCGGITCMPGLNGKCVACNEDD